MCRCRYRAHVITVALTRASSCCVALAELQTLKDAKAADGGDGTFGYWDFRFYLNKEMERLYEVRRGMNCTRANGGPMPMNHVFA